MIPGRVKRFFFSPQHPDCRVTLTTHLHPVLKLRLRGINLSHVFMLWCLINLRVKVFCCCCYTVYEADICGKQLTGTIKCESLPGLLYIVFFWS
jgi:hypothetical protein